MEWYNNCRCKSNIIYKRIQYNIQNNAIDSIKTTNTTQKSIFLIFLTADYRTIKENGRRTRGTIQYNTIQFKQHTKQYNTTQYNSIQYKQHTKQYNTIQYNTIKFNSIQTTYKTIQWIQLK